MVSPVLNEHFYAGGFLVSEAGPRSRDGGTIANAGGSDLSLEAGLVVAQATLGTPTAAAGTNTGNGTIGTLSLQQNALQGAYVVTAKTATTFSVIAPDGRELQDATAGTAYTDEIGFTITAGGTAFVAGDKFTVTVPAGNGQWASWTGGAFTRLGVLYNRCYVPASGSKKVAVVVREAEVNTAELQWDAAVLAAGNVATLQAQALAALNAAGVIAR